MNALVIIEPGGMLVLIEGKGIPSTKHNISFYMSKNFGDSGTIEPIGVVNGVNLVLVRLGSPIEPKNKTLMWWVPVNYRKIIEHELLLAITLASAGLKFKQKGMTIEF